MYKSNIRNKKARGHRNEKKRELILPEEGQEYGFVKDMLGNGRVNVYCEDGKTRVGRIRGSMRRFKHKVIISAGDIILVSRRDYEDDKVDIFHKYSFEEANSLCYHGDLPENITKVYQQKDDMNCSTNPNDSYVVFADELPEEKGSCDEGSSEEEDGLLDVDAI